MKKLSLEEVQYLAHKLAKELMDYDEPLPAFETRYPGKLESCLSQPFQTFGETELYPSIDDKAAILFYLITKNHPFENGNKRMAVATTLVFLFINGFWLSIEPKDLYNLALNVANSKPDEKEKVIKLLTETITKTKLQIRRSILK